MWIGAFTHLLWVCAFSFLIKSVFTQQKAAFLSFVYDEFYSISLRNAFYSKPLCIAMFDWCRHHQNRAMSQQLTEKVHILEWMRYLLHIRTHPPHSHIYLYLYVCDRFERETRLTFYNHFTPQMNHRFSVRAEILSQTAAPFPIRVCHVRIRIFLRPLPPPRFARTTSAHTFTS